MRSALYKAYPLILLLCLFILSACAPIVRSEQGARPELMEFEPGETVGQTFLSRYGGLSALSIFLKVNEPGEGNLRLHLRSSPTSSEDLRSVEIPLVGLAEKGFARFSFPPLPDSTGRDYYALLELTGQGSLQVGAAPEDSYLQGALYRNGEAQDSQLAFRLVYDPALMLLGLLKEGLSWLAFLLVGGFLFVLPGWALLNALLPGWEALSWGEKTGLAAGASLAIYPLLLLWTDLIGLHLGPLYAWLPPLLGGAWLIWRGWRRWKLSPRGASQEQAFFSEPAAGSGRQRGERWADLALVVLLVFAIGVRLWATRGLDLPLFGDSYQHTLMAQLIADNGGLFESWLPYAELYSFTYHFGFHSLAAAFHWITGLPAPQSVLWTGQLVNWLAVVALIPLAVRIGKNRWAGVAAVLIAGLLSPMPNSYANWGRYTQLAGQVILPGAVLVGWLALEQVSRSRRQVWSLNVLAWVLLGGLALTHYIVLIFAVLFFAAWMLLALVPSGGLKETGRRSLSHLTRLIAIGVGGALLFLPWFLHIFIGKIMVNFGRNLSASSQSANAAPASALGNLFVYLPAFLWLLLPLLLAWGLWRRERGAALIALWWFLVFLAANPHWLRLPGSGAISNFAVFIAAYIPAAILGGAAAGWAASTLVCWAGAGERAGPGAGEWARGRTVGVQLLFAVLFLAAGSLWARARLGDVQPAQFALAARPDLRAAAWIKENTPPEARFLVNSFFAYNNTVTAGSDGGWWLPYLAERQSTLPPLTYGVERGPIPNYIRWTNQVTAAIQERGLDDPQVLDLLRERQVTHVYIGQQGGMVNSGGPLIPLGTLLESPHFRPVYHQDRVWIFELLGEP
jgi:hypothetical protein